MQKIAIIGGGIIGMTLAAYIDTNKFEVTLFDHGIGQATSASAGIISPWLSKRRNKKWYRLAKDGAAFFTKLAADTHLTENIYQRKGTIILRKRHFEDLVELAHDRKKEAPEIGRIETLSAAETFARLPLLKPQSSLYISGGGRLDGKLYLAHLKKLLVKKGISCVNEKVDLQKKDPWFVHTANKNFTFDRVLLTAGPHCRELLAPLGYEIDLRPQKGQLIVFQTTDQSSSHFPVAMLDGEADLIPASAGQVIIGATHENEGGWDLTPTKSAFTRLTQAASDFLQSPEKLFKNSYQTRVGTRAYTSDFAPFFGPLPDDESLLIASGLGSSGLTTGPYIGYLLADYLNNGRWNSDHYQKTITHYVQRQQSADC